MLESLPVAIAHHEAMRRVLGSIPGSGRRR